MTRRAGKKRTMAEVLAALSLPDGMTKPYRPKPTDFRETFIAIGWHGIEDHYRTNWRVIRRWVEEEGFDDLRKARADFVRAKRRKRYVLGRTLTAVGSRKRGE